MITPLELEKNDFKGSPLGYSKKSVDDFVNKIKAILYDKELDYSVASGFEYNQAFVIITQQNVKCNIYFSLIENIL